MRRSSLHTAVICCGLVLAALPVFADTWTIVLGTGASRPEAVAAESLRAALTRSGADVRVVDDSSDIPAAGHTAILGTPDHNCRTAALLAQYDLRLPAGSPDNYLVRTLDPKTILLVSGKPIGVIYAANDLIDHLPEADYLDIAMRTPLQYRGVEIWKDFADGATYKGFYPRNWASFVYPYSFEDYIDHVLRLRANLLVVGPFFFRPMSYVDFSQTRYPEAQQFPRDKVAQWRETVNRRLQYAHDRGLRVIFHTYEHNAPANFYRAHADVFNPGGKFTANLDSRGGLTTGPVTFNVVQNMSWNNALYKQFWVDAQTALLQAVPALDGFFATYGEWTKSYEGVPHVDNVIDYIKTNRAVLEKARGDDALLMVRDWYINEAEWADPRMPRTIIVNKFSGFDAGPVEPAPWSQPYIKEGHTVVYQEMTRHGENTDPLIWADADWSTLRMENLKKSGAKGMILHGMPGEPSEEINFSASLLALWDGPRYTNNDALAMLRHYYGAAAAPHVLKAMQRAAFALTEYTKIASGRRAWWQSDGVGIQSVTTGFRGVASYEDPLDYVRRNCTGVPDYVHYLQADATAQKAMSGEWKRRGLLTPDEILDQIEAAAQESEQETFRARELSPDGPYMTELCASALMLRYVAQHYRHYVEAAYDFFILKQHPGDRARMAHLKTSLEEAARVWEPIYYLSATFFPGEIEERFHSKVKDYTRECQQVGVTYDATITLDQEQFAHDVSRIVFNSDAAASAIAHFRHPVWQAGQVDGLTLEAEREGTSAKPDDFPAVFGPGKARVSVPINEALADGALLRVALFPQEKEKQPLKSRTRLKVSFDGQLLRTVESPRFFHGSDQRVLTYIAVPPAAAPRHQLDFEWVAPCTAAIDGVELLK